jgi:hypothetical protein
MKYRRILVSLALLAVVALSQLFTTTTKAKSMAKETKFTVLVENISTPDGQTASDGTKWSFALSPGLWLLHSGKSGLFIERKPASKGLESQSEDGDPSMLSNMSAMMHHAATMYGVFNMPVGKMSPGPIRPGDKYKVSFSASPGMKLSMTMMNGQSNDMFYGPDENGIALFNRNDMPLSGDVTEKFILWDAGTEVNQELGIGPDQGPRQKGINTGADEHGVVTRAKSSMYYTKNAELFRVTITAEAGM